MGAAMRTSGVVNTPARAVGVATGLSIPEGVVISVAAPTSAAEGPVSDLSEPQPGSAAAARDNAARAGTMARRMDMSTA